MFFTGALHPICGDSKLSSLSNISDDEVMGRVLELGRGALMAKAGIKQVLLITWLDKKVWSWVWPVHN